MMLGQHLEHFTRSKVNLDLILSCFFEPPLDCGVCVTIYNLASRLSACDFYVEARGAARCHDSRVSKLPCCRELINSRSESGQAPLVIPVTSSVFSIKIHPEPLCQGSTVHELCSVSASIVGSHAAPAPSCFSMKGSFQLSNMI